MATEGEPILALKGRRTTGQSVRTQNGFNKNILINSLLDKLIVTAAVAIANVVKSSLGPEGLDKMLVDDVGVRNFIFS